MTNKTNTSELNISNSIQVYSVNGNSNPDLPDYFQCYSLPQLCKILKLNSEKEVYDNIHKFNGTVIKYTDLKSVKEKLQCSDAGLIVRKEIDLSLISDKWKIQYIVREGSKKQYFTDLNSAIAETLNYRKPVTGNNDPFITETDYSDNMSVNGYDYRMFN